MRRYAIVTLTLAAASIFASDFVIEVPPRPWIPEHSRTLRRIEGIPHLDDFVQDVAEHGRDAMVDRLTASDPRVLKAVDAARQSVESGAADVVVIVLDNYSDGGVVRLDDVRSGAGTDVQSAVEQLLRNRNLKAGLPPSSAAEWQPRLYVTRVLNGGVVTFEPFTDVLGLLQRTYAAMRAAAERRNNELRAEAEAAQKRGKSRGGSNEGSGDGRLTERPWQSYERPDKPTDAKTSETKTDKPDPPSTDKRKEPKEPKNDTTTEPSEHPSIPMGGQRYVTGPPLTTAEAVLRGLDRDDPVTTRISIAQTLQEFAPWGLPGTRSWLDVDGDARPDFCRSTWAGWMEAPGQQWDAWDWVPPGALSWASYAGSISKAVNRRAYVQAYVCSLTGGKYQHATDGNVVLVPVIDRDLPTSVRWIVSKTGVLVCRDTPDGETTVTRCTRLTPSEGILELEVPEHVWLPKGAQTPVWVDRNGDDHPDRCWIMPATADEQQRFISVPATATYQQELAFVRLSRQSPPKGYTQCALSNGTSWEKPVASTLTYVGYEGMRYWGDVNGDGREDFCRVVDAERMTMLCTESFPSGDRDTLDLLENRGRNRF